MSAYRRSTKAGVGVPALVGIVIMSASMACGDGTTEPGQPLSPEETEALYLGMQELANDPTPNFVSVTANGGVVACPLGGQVTVALDVREEQAGDTVRLVTNVTLDPAGCMLSSQGSEFTLDGNPNVRMVVAIATVGPTLEFQVEGSTTGGVDWQLDDRSGTCSIDLILSAELDTTGANPTPKAVVSGTMCGHEVEFDAAGIGVGG